MSSHIHSILWGAISFLILFTNGNMLHWNIWFIIQTFLFLCNVLVSSNSVVIIISMFCSVCSLSIIPNDLIGQCIFSRENLKCNDVTLMFYGLFCLQWIENAKSTYQWNPNGSPVYDRTEYHHRRCHLITTTFNRSWNLATINCWGRWLQYKNESALNEIICPENHRETTKQVYSNQSSHKCSGHSDINVPMRSSTVELIDHREIW